MDTQICPVCTGSGIVDGGFYNRTSETWTSSGGTEKCRSCDGRGYVIISSAKELDDAKKKILFDCNSYDKEFANFATRLDSDIGILKAMGLEKLGDRLLESAKRLPFANEYYYARQDPQPGEDFGIDDRKPFSINK